ncbi:permease prefix domain 1-containing protein [Liberiplasma polymorphum]|uniref:permease prefix domain 1-containing protein n=1 Tax=Liberiplasma polymorphum TaxID=3374570 RepID=UPI0037748AF4
MKEIHRFVEKLFKHNHLKQEDSDATQKLVEMLTEKVEDLIEDGMEEQEAIHKTIVEFGELEDYYAPLVTQEKRRYKRNKTIQHYKNDLLFSVLSSAIIVGILIYLNLEIRRVYESFGYWFIVPGLAILFWPISLLYKLLNKKGE